jgi:hypothetical protein
MTLVTSLALLLAAFVSPAVLTVAVFVVTAAAAADTLTVRVRALVPPGGIAAPLAQVTREPLAEQPHPLPDADAKLSPAGSASVMLTVPNVLPCPTLETVRVYTPFWPTRNEPEWRLLICRSGGSGGVGVLAGGGVGVAASAVVEPDAESGSVLAPSEVVVLIEELTETEPLEGAVNRKPTFSVAPLARLVGMPVSVTVPVALS